MSSSSDKSPTSEDINSLFDEIETGDKSEHQNVMQKLQAIRLWQLRQQEELKRQQQTQLALLKSQSSGKDLYAIDKEDEDEILAVPISNYPEHLDTILEQSSLIDDSIQNDLVKGDYENHAEDHADPILNQIKENMVLESNNSGEEDTIPFEIVMSDDVKHISFDEPKLKSASPVTNSEDIDLHSDVESSFEKLSPKQVQFDEVPVNSGKTFEEILSQQLDKDKKEQAKKKKTNASTPKRPFLRKGQGIARFNGPPKKPKLKKKPQQQQQKAQPAESNVQLEKLSNAVADIKVDFYCDNLPASVLTSGVKEDAIEPSSNNQVQPKPCIRKTARLNRREPIKQLTLKSDVVKSPQMITLPGNMTDFKQSLKLSFSEDSDNEEKDQNESVWSDAEDTVLALDTSAVNGYNTTSNETFEQMEKFCNEHYADISTVKTLEGDDSVIMQKINPLPPNKLMLRLFPTLRQDNKSENGNNDKNSEKNKSSLKPDVVPNKKELETKIAEGTCTSPPTSQAISNESVQSQILKTKLEEMEAEIKHFQEESAKLSSIRKEEEQKLQELKQEFEEFHLQKEEELQRLSEFKKAEMKKLKKERKIFEEHAAATKALPNKRDREYIQELENKIMELQDEFKLKEQRLTAVNKRLKCQLEVAVEENEKLKENVKQLNERVEKLEKEKESRKSKKSQAAWKAINEMVDSISVNDENANIDDYIETHLQPAETKIKQPAKPLPIRSPLSNRNDNINNSDIMVHEGKIERRKKDGSTEISFQNGTKKMVFPDGTTQIKFTNGDVKTVFPDGTVKYHYTVSGTWHTTHPNGMQVIEFNNKQVERHFPDGSKHISFEDGSSKMIKLNGSEETIFPDGTVMIVTPTGDKTIEYSNGQRETHTAEFKRREYPDGTCKTVFADGRQETKYSSGRLRIKDANGTLIVDRMLAT